MTFGCNTNQKVEADKAKNVSTKTIGDSAIKLVVKNCGHCRTLAPETWTMICNDEGKGCDIWSPDKKMHAGWFIAFVYSYMCPTIDDFINTTMLYIGYKNASLGSGTDLGYGFTKRDFEATAPLVSVTSGTKGCLFYKKYDAPALGGYIVSTYMANTMSDIWDSQGAIPSFVAISIRCVSQLRPDTSGVGSDTSDISSGSGNSELDLSDKWQEAIMGYENVYSPSTGEHYEAPLNSKWETGPEGPGYYRDLPGGGYEKLEPGFGDY
jgi:hypothetical protein